MDEKALNELLECSVCLEQLDDTSKVLPCQHTFCKRCLEEIVSTKHELRCPECRFLVKMRVDDLPSNILLIRLLEGLKTQSRIAPGRKDNGGSPSRGDNSPQVVAAFARQQQQRQAVTGNLPCAKALFNYDAKDPGDLSFKKGDIVYLRKQVDENWFHGELGNNHGFFPATYVQVLTPLPSTIPQCKALYDFTTSGTDDEDCLSFKKDEVIIVIRQVDENWLEGKKGDKIGIFPLSFVKLNDPARKILFTLTNLNSQPSTDKGQPTEPCPALPAKERSPVTGYNIFLSGLVASNQNKRHSLTNLTQNTADTQVEGQSGSSTPHRRSLDSSNVDPGLLAAGGLTPVTVVTTGGTQTSPAQSVAGPLEVAGVLSASGGPEAAVGSSDTGPGSATEKGQQKAEMPLLGGEMVTARASPSKLAPLDIMSASYPGPALLEENTQSLVYVAMYNYKPQKVDELELVKGEYYTVSEKCMDGWFKGVSLKTAQAGVFPGNYVQSFKSNPNSNKPTNKSSIAKPKALPNSQQPNSISATPTSIGQSTVSPPRPVISSSEAVGRSRARLEVVSKSGQENATKNLKEGGSKSILEMEGRSRSSERVMVNNAPPVAQRNPQTVVPLTSKGSRPASSSSPSSPVLSTGTKTTRYVRASKSTSPNIGIKVDGAQSGTQSPALSSASSPVWKHSMTNSANSSVTPPNVVMGTGANAGVKEKKKDKEKISLMKRLTSSKGKKGKSLDVDGTSLNDSAIIHSRSGSYPCEVSPILPEAGKHKKSGSFDLTSSTTTAKSSAKSSISSAAAASSSASSSQTKPSRPKPLTRETYRCIVAYPAQSEIELDLKVGDVIFVHKKREDGWFKGTLQRSGKTGLVPGNFVEKYS